MQTTGLETPRAPLRDHRLAGIALLLGATACFACIDASAKWLNRSMVLENTVRAARYRRGLLPFG